MSLAVRARRAPLVPAGQRSVSPPKGGLDWPVMFMAAILAIGTVLVGFMVFVIFSASLGG